MPLSLRAPIFIAAAVVIGGCSAPVVDDVSDASGAMTDAVVLVERTVSADGATQTHVSAKFMRLSTPADPEVAEGMVGSKLALPPVGACRRVEADSDGSAALGSIGSIELLDVGDVSLRTGGSVMTLAARAFPDVGDLVSGMFYTSRDAASDLPSAATYTLEGTGSAQVERFAIEADAPAAPEDVRLGDVMLGDAPAIEEGSISVRWRADPQSSAAKGAEDLVLVDITAASGASVRCTFADSGRGVLPAWVWSSSELGALPASATVAVHRVRERSFVVPGLDTGAVRFDLSVVGRVTVSPRSAPSQQP